MQSIATFPGTYVINETPNASSVSVNAFGSQSTAGWGAPTTGDSLYGLAPVEIVLLNTSALVGQHAAGNVVAPAPTYQYMQQFWIKEFSITYRVVNMGNNPIQIKAYPWVARKTNPNLPHTMFNAPELLESTTLADTYDEQGNGVSPYDYKLLTECFKFMKTRTCRLLGGEGKSWKMSWKGSYRQDDVAMTSGMLGGLTRGMIFTSIGYASRETGGVASNMHSVTPQAFIVSASKRYKYQNSIFPYHFHDFVNQDTTAVTTPFIVVPQTAAAAAPVYV